METDREEKMKLKKIQFIMIKCILINKKKWYFSNWTSDIFIPYYLHLGARLL